MVLEDIFAIDDSEDFYSIKWESEDDHAFSRFFEQMNDPMFLHAFFKNHEDDLQSYRSLTINDAVRKARKDANELEKELLEASENGELYKYFQALSKNEIVKRENLERAKCYGVIENSFIRIYAVKLDDRQYAVTGGAIKLSGKMQDRAHTQLELDKMNKVIDYLIREGVFELPL